MAAQLDALQRSGHAPATAKHVKKVDIPLEIRAGKDLQPRIWPWPVERNRNQDAQVLVHFTVRTWREHVNVVDGLRARVYNVYLPVTAIIARQEARVLADCRDFRCVNPAPVPRLSDVATGQPEQCTRATDRAEPSRDGAPHIGHGTVIARLAPLDG